MNIKVFKSVTNTSIYLLGSTIFDSPKIHPTILNLSTLRSKKVFQKKKERLKCFAEMVER